MTDKLCPFQRYLDIARVESLTPIRPTIRPQIKAEYQVIFEYRYAVELFAEVWLIRLNVPI